MIRKLGMSAVAVAMAVSAVVVGIGPLSPQPAGADETYPASESCTVGSVTWTAHLTVRLSDFGPLVKVDRLTRTDPNGTVDASGREWEWRLDSPNGGGNLRPQGPRQPSPDGSQWFGVEYQSAVRSPRVVAPDGSCDIYIAPFANAHGDQSWPKVAVLGDSLTASLNDSTISRTYRQGYVERALNTDATLAEVEGQGGRAWTDVPLADPLDNAFDYLLDEFRGIDEHDPDGVIVGLGPNDAIRLATTPADQRDAARTRVHDRLRQVLAEMYDNSDCLVVVTGPQQRVMRWFIPGEIYEQEITQINNILRFWANVDPDDHLYVADFAAEARNHQYGSADPWFIDDNIHFPRHDVDPDGMDAYTNYIRFSAAGCTP